MIYLRKLLDMFVLSMLPSLISFLLMSRFLNYTTWFVCGIVSTIIFFVGNGLLIRRFVRDIKSTSTYYIVWIVTYIVYVAGGILCLAQGWMYPFTWIYFHTRIVAIIALPIKVIPVWISFAISSLVFLAMIFIERPIAAMLYEKEVAENQKKEIEAIRLARETRKMYEEERLQAEQRRKSNKSTTVEEIEQHRRRVSMENDERYSIRQLRKMEKFNNAQAVRKQKQIGAQKAMGKKMLNNISDFILNLGSYSFYQFLAEKVEQGNNPGPIIISYIRRRLNLGIRAPRKR